MGAVVTLVMPFYLNSGMLAVQYQGWKDWSDELKERWHIILVDDGSPEPAIDVSRPKGLPKLSIYRVLEDRPWHQHAARNLGAHQADAGWMVLTDMDHVLSADAAQEILRRIDELEVNPKCIYMLDRVEGDTGDFTTDKAGNPKPHPNSFFLTKRLYWKIGGYDEDFCGLYGTDSMFKARAFVRGHKAHLHGVALRRFWRDLVADASTTTLQRKEGREPNAKRRILAEKAARGEAGVIKTLQFPWTQVL